MLEHATWPKHWAPMQTVIGSSVGVPTDGVWAWGGCGVKQVQELHHTHRSLAKTTALYDYPLSATEQGVGQFLGLQVQLYEACVAPPAAVMRMAQNCLHFRQQLQQSVLRTEDHYYFHATVQRVLFLGPGCLTEHQTSE